MNHLLMSVIGAECDDQPVITQDHVDDAELALLENDVEELSQEAVVLSEQVEEVNEGIAGLEEMMSSGCLDIGNFHSLYRRVEQISQKLKPNLNTVLGNESFMDPSLAALEARAGIESFSESVKAGIAKIVKFVKDFFAKVGEFLKGLFKKKTYAERENDRVQKELKKATGENGKKIEVKLNKDESKIISIENGRIAAIKFPKEDDVLANAIASLFSDAFKVQNFKDVVGLNKHLKVIIDFYNRNKSMFQLFNPMKPNKQSSFASEKNKVRYDITLDIENHGENAQQVLAALKDLKVTIEPSSYLVNGDVESVITNKSELEGILKYYQAESKKLPDIQAALKGAEGRFDQTSRNQNGMPNEEIMILNINREASRIYSQFMTSYEKIVVQANINGVKFVERLMKQF